ncbi:hypothetical protein [Brachybacterium ginsengisoli]|uniref:hypothetical protein n=1 Tax=Brachybacterium ginsengisoli TaxID=1331682 RepID=UPI001476530E|nr:hypothetical protein [Brachybacterium ginsengisoli]
MTFLRSLSSTLGRLSDRMQGQDIERADAASDRRFGSNYAALVRSHSTQGISPLSMGR